ncbi:MAG: AzlD domain-containing protein [Clostridia bacterium]|nr:AzlD domain-containing protein [Clostridia bacterium]
MKSREIFLLIFGMAAVTYLPRALPVFIMDKIKISKKADRFLKLLSYSAMSALIFPGIFSIDSAYPFFGIAGGITATLLALKKRPLIVCVLSAVAVNCGFYLVFGGVIDQTKNSIVV